MANLYSTCAGFKVGQPVLLEQTIPALRQFLITLTQGGSFRSSKGTLTHESILNSSPGDVLITSSGAKVIVRHPLLWEYVRLMPRGPTPCYPKDIWAMMGLLDVRQGACVLEAGSGSGALTLHLSQAVGPSGCVFSFDKSPEHLQRAKSNYNTWTGAHEWPDNVHFVGDCVGRAGSYCRAPLDAVSLDLVDPCAVLSKVLPLLRPNAPLIAYQPNVSQLLSFAKSALSAGQDPPSVLEVTHRQWTVKPARLKPAVTNSSSYYIARPSHHQLPHTGFLALIRRKP